MQKESKTEKRMTVDEVNRIRRASYIKMTAMVGFVVAIIAFSSIAWFTMNREVEGSGVQMKADDTSYVIISQSGSPSAFNDKQNLLEITDANVWEMTDENNMKNYGEEAEGIGPGSYGKICFYVEPKGESVMLDLSFEVVGYQYNEEETPPMTRVNSGLQDFLTGHILLFETRTPYPNENNVEYYIYSDPILTDPVTGLRVSKNKTFTKVNKNTPKQIYWVWAKTLSKLVDVSDENSGVSVVPLCANEENNDEDYQKIVANIIAHPTRYFDSYTGTGTLTENEMVTAYDTFGGKYDSADYQIGRNVHYVTLRMTTKESTSGGA